MHLVAEVLIRNLQPKDNKMNYYFTGTLIILMVLLALFGGPN
jgi:predicted nucleic acid-binding Zn ribbon protein|tara:strand:+ start:217 stop:342 length:126 start_codon:yes stop_codon:yes gene_type:complete